MSSTSTGTNGVTNMDENKILSDEAALEAMVSKSRTTKYNSYGHPNCQLCGKSIDTDKFSFAAHLEEAHGISFEEYKEKYPDCPTENQENSSKSLGMSLDYKDRTKKDFNVLETFGFNWINSQGKADKNKVVKGYAEPGPLTPEINPSYVFDPEATMVALLGLHLRNKILTYGPTGSGKTTLWEQIAAHLNYNCVRINFDSGITRPDLVGQFVVRGREMEFQYGILPRAMSLPGTIVVFDEWDTVSEECAFVIQRPLEESSQLLIMEQGEEVVSLHPENTIVATANTAGMGDETGIYSAGTRVQNFSQVNRFSMTIHLDYLDKEEEKKILVGRFDGDVSELEAEHFVNVANKMREAFKEGKLSAPLSTRDVINWTQKYTFWGDPMKAARYCFINRFAQDEQEVIQQIVKRAFPKM